MNPLHPEKNTANWQTALEAANKAKRCGAKTRRAIYPCKSPAMPNGRCRMHGGKSTGAPGGITHKWYKHGRCTREARQERKKHFADFRLLCSMYPWFKTSTNITLEDIDFDITAIKTHADVNNALDEIWEMLMDGELTFQECEVVSKALRKRSESLLKTTRDELLKIKQQIEMT